MRYYYFKICFCLALMLASSLIVPLHAQTERFVKVYNDSIPLIGVKVLETPTGFEIKQEKANYNAPFHFKALAVNQEGDSISAQIKVLNGEAGFDPVFALADGTYARSEHNSHRIQRFAADGTMIWDTTYIIPDFPIIVNSVYNPIKMIGMASNGDLLVGFRANTVGDYCVMQINANQEIVWVKKFWNFGPLFPSIDTESRFFHFTPSPDGSFFLTMNTSSGSIYSIFKISATGEKLWQKAFTLEPFMIKPTSDGGIWVSIMGTGGQNRLILYGTDGSELFNKEIQQIVFYQPFPYKPSALIEMQDGTVVMAGYHNSNNNIFFMRMDLQGQILWLWEGIPFANAPMLIRHGIATADGGYAWTGQITQNGKTKTILIKTDNIGRPTTNYVSGHVRWDQNTDCSADTTELPVSNWLVQLKKQSTIVTYAITDADGYYEMPVTGTGTYTVKAVAPNFIWDACIEEYTFSMPQGASDTTVTLNFAAQHGYDCPVMSIDIGAAFLRRCFDNYMSLRCCNDGVLDAINASVAVILPPHLDLISVSVPYTLNGDTLRIEMDTFKALTCRYIGLVVKPNCDSSTLGESMCFSARIYPDTICAPIPSWSGALIEVAAACEQDSVRFQIQNVGSAQSQMLDYIVIDDHVMTRQDSFTLVSNGLVEVVVPATGGTIRILAEQEPNAPGAPQPSIAVEGCGVDSSGNTSTGLIVQWPNENGSPFSDTKCWEVKGSFDPNDKSAIPQGVQDQHYIQPNTPIDYTIRFQNTGTDTAFTVVIKDLIDFWLNIQTIRPGASSHPYVMTFDGLYRVVFTFNNILLPDSNTNLVGSMGFVQFQIQQKTNIEGFPILNEASIYFDYNAPIVTNTVMHTVRKQIIPPLVVPTKTVVSLQLPSLEIWPNPSADAIWVKSPYPNGAVMITDALGRAVHRLSVQSLVSTIYKNQISPGIYWIQWMGDQGVSRMEKVIWE